MVSKAETKAKEIARKAFSARDVDVNGIVKQFAKFWGMKPGTEAHDELLTMLEARSNKTRIDYLLEFPYAGDDNLEGFIELCASKDWIELPESERKEVDEEEPAPRKRKATAKEAAPAKTKRAASTSNRQAIEGGEIPCKIIIEGDCVKLAAAMGIKRAPVEGEDTVLASRTGKYEITATAKGLVFTGFTAAGLAAPTFSIRRGLAEHPKLIAKAEVITKGNKALDPKLMKRTNVLEKGDRYFIDPEGAVAGKY